jgi:hypothetical protein
MRKNGGMLLAVSIIIVVIVIFYTNGKVKKTPSRVNEYESLMLSDFEKDYPQNPSDLISKNNDILKYLYSENILENQVEKLVILQRKLFAKTLVDSNSQVTQIVNVSEQVKLNKKNKVKIVDIEVYPPEYPEEKNNLICVIKAKHYMSKGGNIYRTYTVIKENNEQWKIYNWVDSSKDFVPVEEMKK